MIASPFETGMTLGWLAVGLLLYGVLAFCMLVMYLAIQRERYQQRLHKVAIAGLSLTDRIELDFIDSPVTGRHEESAPDKTLQHIAIGHRGRVGIHESQQFLNSRVDVLIRMVGA